MCGPVLALLVLVPVVEIVVLIEVGQRIGGLETFWLVLVAAALGLSIARRQGLATVQHLREGLPPQAAILGGPLVLLAAVLLVIPGFVTDVVGLLLLVPPVRRAVARRLARRLGGPGGDRVFVFRHGAHVGRRGGPQRPPAGEDPGVIDVEVVRKERGEPRDDDDERS